MKFITVSVKPVELEKKTKPQKNFDQAGFLLKPLY